MERTTNLRLQKPQRGDVYNSDVITKNVETADRYMANIGGNTLPKVINNLEQFITAGPDFDLISGSLRILGNGLGYIDIRFSNKHDITPTNGQIPGVAIVGTIFPEYGTAISQPLTSAVGMSIGGYIAPNSTRVVIKHLKGYVSSTIGAGTELQLAGIYPLAVVPSTIGLEQMPSKSFDHLVHEKNLKKIDSVGSKLKVKQGGKTYTQAEALTSVIAPNTVSSFYLYRNTNGMMTFDITFRTGINLDSGLSGNIANREIAALLPGLMPDYYVKLFTTHTGVIAHGEINPTTGVITLCSVPGKNYIIPSTENIQLQGSWYYAK